MLKIMHKVFLLVITTVVGMNNDGILITKLMRTGGEKILVKNY